ncbi:MAG: response regulator [Desulfocapsaceae bacterium]|nr:response regulator [Desulfocapsaceae bacterium]
MQHSILVVDDEPQYCSTLKFLLEANGYCVEIAQSGRDALSCLQKDFFHAVLLDLNLPDTYGIQVAEYIKQNHPDTAIIIQTGHATVNSAIQAMRYGVFDFLCKPNKAELVLETIARGIENKQLRLNLEQSEKRFRLLAEATWEGIAIFIDSRLRHVNTQLCAIFGYTEAELLVLPFSDIIVNWDDCRAASHERDNDTTGAAECSGRHKDGRIIPVEVRCKYIDGLRNQVVAIRDVSARKAAERKRLELQRRLADAKRMESLGLMASIVAHDLNNILTGIVTFPELLLSNMSPSDKFRNEIELIHKAGRQAADVVADLLAVARGTKCKKEPHNLNLLISSYIDSIEYRKLESDFPCLTIDVGLEPDLPSLNCSAIHIAKSIINLVMNAAEACDENGYVTIRTIRRNLIAPIRGYEEIPAGEYVVLSVSDNGSGIPADGLERIFEPFYSKKELGRSGTGLGLTVIWNTVRDHQGYIDLASNWAGSRFDLYFPVSQDEERVALESLTLEPMFGKGEKILIVDDEESQRKIACLILQQLGYSPRSVDSGRNAVEYIKKEQVDLVVLDMIMEPDMDGCRTFAEILKYTPGQKAVITSGYWNKADQERMKALGISQYITKPYSLACIARAIRLEIDRQA